MINLGLVFQMKIDIFEFFFIDSRLSHSNLLDYIEIFLYPLGDVMLVALSKKL